MIIKNTQMESERIKKGLFCSHCGQEVPFERKYLTQFCQTKIKDRECYIVFLSYGCPRCSGVTNSTRHYDVSLKETMNKIKLYNY